MVRPRGLEPPRLSSLAPQASASTNSAMAANGDPGQRLRGGGAFTRSKTAPQARPASPRGVRRGRNPLPWRYGLCRSLQEATMNDLGSVRDALPHTLLAGEGATPVEWAVAD